MTDGRELLIMRHAKSDWSSGASGDFERPLNRRGREAAPRMGRWLIEQRLHPDQVVSSPALRAAQTARLVTAELGFDERQIDWREEIYEAAPGTLLRLLAVLPALPRTLLIGHNPGLERLLAYLVASLPSPEDANLLPTATVARLRLGDDWGDLQPGSGQLLALVRPKSLTD